MLFIAITSVLANSLRNLASDEESNFYFASDDSGLTVDAVRNVNKPFSSQIFENSFKLPWSPHMIANNLINHIRDQSPIDLPKVPLAGIELNGEFLLSALNGAMARMDGIDLIKMDLISKLMDLEKKTIE
eukprot:GHVH01004990.1.p1 GENE.GHVH01004990.1~~GHVH01004990.1.p1  ORF type:complete len:130 (+),score=13.47 GHVH01004990.1:109-498(+)